MVCPMTVRKDYHAWLPKFVCQISGAIDRLDSCNCVVERAQSRHVCQSRSLRIQNYVTILNREDRRTAYHGSSAVHQKAEVEAFDNLVDLPF